MTLSELNSGRSEQSLRTGQGLDLLLRLQCVSLEVGAVCLTEGLLQNGGVSPPIYQTTGCH